MDSTKLAAINKSFNAERALKTCARLYKSDRDFTFSAFHRTSRLVTRIMEKAGLRDIEIHSFPADGHTVYGDWTVPRAWDLKAASLKIRSGRRWLMLADRRQDLCAPIMYSAPTPGNKVAECRIVPARMRSQWKGNLVLLKGGGRKRLRQLAAGGALGLVTDAMPTWKDCRSREEVYDTTLWNNGLFAPANEHQLVGFQLTPRQGDRLRQALRQGPVDARALVDARLYDGTIDFVTGVLPGQVSCREEGAVFSHLFEPGAHDNASGCAMGLEALQTLGELTAAGCIAPLRRSLRLCYTFEVFGTLAYFQSHPEAMQPLIAAINPDMVAPDMEKCRSRLHVYGTPDSAPSYVDALIGGYIEKAFAQRHLLRWSEMGFFINDNFVTDPAIDIPCPALICLRDRFYHSSGDVPENLSPVTMQAVGAAMSAYLHDISRGDAATAAWLGGRIAVREIARMQGALQNFRTMGGPVGDVIQYRANVAAARLSSIKRLVKGNRSKGARTVPGIIADSIAAVNAFAQARHAQTGRKSLSAEWAAVWSVPSRLKKAAAALYPRKKVLGTFTFEKLNRSQARHSPGNSAWSYAGNAAAFWANGQRSVFDIWRNVCLESGKPIPLDKTMSHFEFLIKNGYAE